MNRHVANSRHLPAKVVVSGLGNIGSPFISHLARMESVGEVTLIDCDRYEESNGASQEIHRSDISRPKALVQGQRMRQIAPALRVHCCVDRLENVPWGEFRSNAMIACLDTRISRIHVNEIAWRLNVPWIDAAVDAENWLARVNVYLPGSPEAPCYECSFSDADYAAVEQVFRCHGDRALSTPTNAPSYVGALAAAMQAVECQKLLAGDLDHLLAGREVLIDLRNHRHFLTRIRRNPACRFDHQSLQIMQLTAGPGQVTVDGASQLVAGTASRQLRVPGHRLARRVVCPGCLKSRDLLRLHERLLPRHVDCANCGGTMEPTGFDLSDWLEIELLDRSDRRRTLRNIGLRPHDVFAIRGDDQVHYFELGDSP